MTSLNIEPMVPDEEAEDMLDSCCLQVSDLRKEIPLRLFGIRDARGLVGIVGVECNGCVALRPSLAVREDARKSGYGRLLVWYAEDWASQQGITERYLLTTTAP